MAPRSQIGQGSVVESAAHSEAVTARIEADQRNEQQVQCPGQADAAVAQAGLGNTVDVPRQRTPFARLDEPELSVGVCPKDGKKDALVAAVGEVQERGGVNLTVVATVSADSSGTQEEGVASKAAGERKGVPPLLRGR